ncbi:HdeD family acid-resistance protein [Lentibacter sp. XHP0401]|uniref:HdeD family acid-resistance protein n=1 Tax=Lentibacter sp. XHP0401 TaxID=2984334 RepID=UPI0021E6EA11|nr:DUF308 domain-containing protein [Lentibacter sp. XHP0401]MCV2891897.1 DUF308 domain-containing protein [Lentibacter sp. XHP0401]
MTTEHETTYIDISGRAAPAALLARMHKGLFWAGVVMIVLGIAALVMPLVSSLIVEIMIGWLLTLSGAISVVGAFSLRSTRLFLWELVAGLITFAVGLWMLFFPLQGLVALTILVAVMLILTGAAQFAFALWARSVSGWAWGILSALISIALGVYILFVLPEASAVILGVIVGIDFLSTGIAFVLISQSVRRGLEA